jgi:hypothetical protein
MAGHNYFFNNIVVLGRWWFKNLILRHVSKKCFLVSVAVSLRVWLQSFLSAHMSTPILLLKHAEYDADFEDVEKIATNSC